MDKVFFKLEVGWILSPLGYLLDGNVNIHMWSTKSDIFFCGVHCIDFSENFVRGHLR